MSTEKQTRKEIATDRRIYVSTYPTMLNIVRHEEKNLGPHFFDLVIVDESHRSIYNTYREILDYFNVLTLGLTATPTDVIDHNTFELFECEDGIPTFAYSYEEAVNHLPPYLCNFQVLKIKTRFQDEGISKRTISLEDQQKLIHEGKEKDKFETLKESIVEELGELPMTINLVAKEGELIRQAQTNHFWATISEEKLDDLIDKIAPLMKFRQGVVPLGPAKFNLKDVIATKQKVEFGPQHESLSVAKYRELVEQKINELLEGSPILQKLKEGLDISTEEAAQLADELHNGHPHITIELLRKVYNHRKAELVQFIRHILGIETLESFSETVARSFEGFIQQHNYLSGRQLQFLEMLRTFIIERGQVTKRNLIESPFTMLHPEGIRGIFTVKEIDEIIALTNKVLAA